MITDFNLKNRFVLILLLILSLSVLVGAGKVTHSINNNKSDKINLMTSKIKKNISWENQEEWNEFTKTDESFFFEINTIQK